MEAGERENRGIVGSMMLWLGVGFLWVGTLVAAGVFVVSGRARAMDEDARAGRGPWAVAAGALWPVLAVGLVQLAAIAVTREFLGAWRSPAQRHALAIAAPASRQPAGSRRQAGRLPDSPP